MPTKGSPCASSSAPGASPTNTRCAFGLPTPKTRFVRPRRQLAALAVAELLAHERRGPRADRPALRPSARFGGAASDSGRDGDRCRDRRTLPRPPSAATAGATRPAAPSARAPPASSARAPRARAARSPDRASLQRGHRAVARTCAAPSVDAGIGFAGPPALPPRVGGHQRVDGQRVVERRRGLGLVDVRSRPARRRDRRRAARARR